ncbi:MAG: 2-hydroxyacyl-CoA dehydratase [Nitrospirae bacterium]|nr:2-hydroxyacyl-CoA dehydratase [Nitrospirota bacterium]
MNPPPPPPSQISNIEPRKSGGLSLISVASYVFNYQLVGKPFLAYQRHQDERKLKALKQKPQQLLAPPLVRTARMKEMMSRHYLQARYANGVRKVAWVTSGAPVEILQALGFVLIYPENHAALCGARKKAEEICTEAENAGYSRDLCSYARTDLGTLLSGKTIVGRLPRPDLLLCCNNICQTVHLWYRVLASRMKVPLVLIDTPFLYEPAQPHQIEFVKRQIEEMIPVAERVAGKSLSMARLKEVARYSKDAAELWLEILNRGRQKPSPITAFDGFTNMGPIVDLRGEAETVEFYRSLLEEIDERIAAGIPAVKGEKYRVLWDNLPIWYRMGWLSKTLGKQGINLVASDYTYAWGELAPMMDVEKPLDTAARVYLHPILNRSTGDKLRSMKRMVKDFDLHGVILHSDRSCKPYSLGQIDQRDRLTKDLGLAAVLLEADHNDPRAFSEEQALGRIEAFAEMLH